jgi:hypothetical protein
MLLVLYVFMTAPTQLWHHHVHPINESTVDDKIYVRQIGESKLIQVEELDCQICSHHYSVHLSADLELISIENRVQAIDKKSCQLATLSPCIQTTFNKGPPSLIQV